MHWIEFTIILLPGLAFMSVSALPLAIGTVAAIRHLRAWRRSLYLRNVLGSMAAGFLTLALLWSSLFGDALSRSSTAVIIFVFIPIYSAGAFLVGYLLGRVLSRTPNGAEERGGIAPPISVAARQLVWIPILLFSTVMFGIVRYSILSNDLAVAERASRPATLNYVFEKAERGDADTFGVQLFLAQNPNTPSDLLEKLSKSTESQVRGFVATNPNTPISVLANLRDDCDGYVRKAVQKRLNDGAGSNNQDQLTPKCGTGKRKN